MGTGAWLPPTPARHQEPDNGERRKVKSNFSPGGKRLSNTPAEPTGLEGPPEGITGGRRNRATEQHPRTPRVRDSGDKEAAG